MRVLVTGASGFVGPHAAAALRAGGHDVHGFARRAAPADWPGEWHRGELREIGATVERVGPEAVVHLAGARSGSLPELLATNVDGTEAVVAAAARVGARVVVAGSSAEAGRGAPVAEQDALAPVSDYGRSKARQSVLALGRGALVARFFNLLGPGLPDSLAAGAFSRQIAAAERGSGPPVVRTGNLAGIRDYVDVRDAAAALALLVAATGVSGLYNVCSGTGTSTRALLDLLIAEARVPLAVEEAGAPSAAPAADVDEQVGDPARLRAATGWRAAIPLEQSLRDLLESWRQIV